MAEKLQNQLKVVGAKLENPPANKDALIKLLKQAAASLSELEQSPSKSVLESMQPFIKAIVKPELLKHHDKEVKLLVATCTCEITRVTAPEAPYDDAILKDIFHLIVSTFSGLRDTKSPSFGRRVTILEAVAKYRSCIVMLDLGCDDLVNEMFRTFFAVVSDAHSESVIASMKTIMVVLLEESEDISEDLLLIILSVLGRNNKGITMAARRLAMNVIRQCAGKLEPSIKQFIIQSMSGESRPSFSQIDYHEVIYDIYQCAPQAIAGIVPYLAEELLTEKLDIRLKAVKLAGELFSINGSSIPETFQPIFFEFMRRLTDRAVEIRLLILEHAKFCMFSNPFRPEASQLIAALCDRLLDYDQSIRQKVIAVVSDIACRELSSISGDTIKLVAERLRDKSLPVKKYTMERLSDVYKTYCSKHKAGLTLSDDYDWIPGRILRGFYDKDFRSDTVEHILCTSLFPAKFSVRDKVRTWVRLFSKFDKVEVKALERILEQKQRLQLELQKYLSLRQMHKDGGVSELQKKVALCFHIMSRCFTDPTKAEADFKLLHQLRDAKVWKIFSTLLDPATNSLQTWRSRDELLKIVGQKHPLYGILSTLSMKCSCLLFNRDFVKDIFLEVDMHKSSRNRLLTQSCMNMLVILASFNPLLLSGTEKDLVRLLEDDNEVIKEGVLRVLVKAGGTVRKQLGESSSRLDLILERTCVEGSRRLAKYAVYALATITKDDGLKSISDLYKKLVDVLEKRTHLPSVLQSLGCIAQIATSVFKIQEAKIRSFIKTDILGCSEKTRDKSKRSWDDKSELCSLKIYGIKTLVNSFLPVKDAHLCLGIDELIKDLRNLLSYGEISKDIKSSSIDKAHLKLASAKAVLRLSKHWDKIIPIDVFHLTLRTSEIGFPEAKKLYLNKVHRYIKDRSLDPKYACAFLLASRSQQSVQDDHNLSDIIQMCRQGKARQISVQSDGNPEYILPYLIHALAHHPSCPNVDKCKDVKAYESIYRRLYLFLSILTLGDEAGEPGDKLKREDVISVVSILRSIKSSEDAVATNMSKNSYAICDLCFSITKRLAQKPEDLQEPAKNVHVPEVLYKSREMKKEKKKEEVTEVQTWLGEASSISHFESLDLEVDESVPSYTIEDDDDLKDSETDENDVPIGTILQRLKAKGAKEGRALENGSSTAAAKKVDKNVIDLGLARRMNLDNSGVSTKFDSNGHGKPKAGEKKKRKITKTNEAIDVSVTKRLRSKGHNDTEGLSASDNIRMSDEPLSVPENKPLLEGEHIASGDLDGRGHMQTDEYGNADDSNLEKPRKYTDSDGNRKSGSVRKRKRRNAAKVVKCTSKEGKSHTTDLIGRKIKVWWPQDEEFYEGLVKSYDHQKKKHVVLYNDGDVEVLRLDKELWELIDKNPKPTKRNSSLKNPHSEKRSGKKKEVSNNSKKSKDLADMFPSSMVRGRRTPRKYTKQRQKMVSQKTPEYMEVERNEYPEMMEYEPDRENESESEREYPTFSKVDNLDSENSFTDNESSKEYETDSGQKRIDNGEKFDEEEKQSPSSTREESAEEENRSGLGCVEEDAENQATDHRKSSASDGSEFSDDMPLGVWKSQGRKPDKRK